MSKENIKIRKTWPEGFDPNAKLEKVKTNYHRKNNKKAIEEALQEANDENTDLDFGY